MHALVDPGTFLEIGALAKTPNDPNALYGDGCVTGHAMIDGRPVGVFSHDQTVFQGTVGEMFGRKVARLMEWCAMVGCPIIGIQDSGGARIQDAVTSLAWYAELGRRHEALSGLVPQISLIFGKCAGGAVYSPIQDDLLVSVRDQGYFFVTGPDVIREVTGEDVTLDELGGSDAQARYGNIHQVVNSEAEAFQYVRDFLSFLPSSAFSEPPVVNPAWSRRRRRPIWSSTRSCRTRTTWPTTCTRSCCGSSTTATSSTSPRNTGRPSSPGMPGSTGTRSA